MPKCSNCKRGFEAYSMETTKLPVIGQKPLEVIKLICPLCKSMQHLLSPSHNHTDNNFQLEQVDLNFQN